ncbi:hypothetical protein Dvul_2967 (plasmid) [Nitratidesulfovibrio vulgaris DP4]|uniref:Uncharacterized protein n=1 Tax=Nitratidesulfovibrio vulgaris (strain DP4) TaxID=391774 RepID=A0A0H3AC20_NITV4|nr:hypothetical protein Dvul_2967 [Nitratidesulfovibrio vulgaris DP4]
MPIRRSAGSTCFFLNVLAYMESMGLPGHAPLQALFLLFRPLPATRLGRVPSAVPAAPPVNAASDIPCRRHREAGVIPASACLRVPKPSPRRLCPFAWRRRPRPASRTDSRGTWSRDGRVLGMANEAGDGVVLPTFLNAALYVFSRTDGQPWMD